MGCRCAGGDGAGGGGEVSASVSPRSWRIGCLSEVAAKVPNAIVDGPFGSNLKLSDYVSSGVPVLQGKNITNDKFRWFDVRFISDSKGEELKRSSVRVGDLLIVKIGSIGYSAIVDSLAGYDFAVIPANLAKITPDLNVVQREYLHHWLTSPDAKRYLLANASKTAQPALSLGKIRALPIPIPPLEDQRRIAAILDQAETLRIQRRAALAQLDSLTQSIFLDMFGDPVTNPKGIRKAALVDIADISTGSTPGRSADGYYEGSIPWVKTTEVAGSVIFDTDEKLTDSGLRAIRGKLHPVNSILVAMYGQGQTRGRCALLGIEAACNQACGVIRPNESFLPSFMFVQLLLAYDRLRALGRGGNQENLNLQLLGSFEVLLPPLPLQQTFATRIQAIESLKATHRAALTALDALFASLQQRAFAGAL